MSLCLSSSLLSPLSLIPCHMLQLSLFLPLPVLSTPSLSFITRHIHKKAGSWNVCWQVRFAIFCSSIDTSDLWVAAECYILVHDGLCISECGQNCYTCTMNGPGKCDNGTCYSRHVFDSNSHKCEGMIMLFVVIIITAVIHFQTPRNEIKQTFQKQYDI